MQIKDYLNDILAKISANPYVESQNISFSERPPDAAYLTGIITLIDGSQFHFKEFVLFKSEAASIVKYGYNYLGKDDNLIFRYDNALDPKARKLSTYPEHKHAGEGLSSAKRPLLEEVLQEITARVKQHIQLQP